MSELLDLLLARAARPAGDAGHAGDGPADFAGTPVPEAFALLYRPERTGDRVEILLGDPGTAGLLSELPLTGTESGDPEGAADATDGPRHQVLALIPYRQITERGFVCQDDHAPIRTLTVRRQGTVGVDELVRRLPRTPVELRDAGFDLDDQEYEAIVRDVIKQEIGSGEGANFVIHRTFTADLPGFGPEQALSVYRRLLAQSQGAYWVFLVYTGDHMMLGATPERHISVDAGTAVMNPISGTYRYPPAGPELGDLAAFLRDRKEADELLMVVDEELKMIAGFCPDGGIAHGPYLKEMARLAHTEYLIEGRTRAGVDAILRGSLFAPTVTGSPLENACRVIARHERGGRGYYSGVAALIGRDSSGEVALDSAIVIRTAEVDAERRLRLGVGATLVRLSDPAAEAAETRAKAAGLLAAFGVDEEEEEGEERGEREAGVVAEAGRAARPVGAESVGAELVGTELMGAELVGAEPVVPAARTAPVRLGEHPEVRALLGERNRSLARFWLEPGRGGAHRPPELAERRGLVIEAEDTFTAMLARQMEALGCRVEVRSWRDHPDPTAYDFAVVGPGPGDPRDLADPKIATLRRAVRRLLAKDVPFLGVCLGHQVVSGVLGLDLVRRDRPNQGVQLPVRLPWGEELVGFYNTFAAVSAADSFELPGLSRPVEVSRDPVTGQVHAMRGPGFATVQFHPESVLTEHGPGILSELLCGVLAPVAPVAV
ncbi:anthranilate synthase family protein [Streptomyces sp. NPDC046374]|uniref:anthranilate synthase family protein n=1 Tax=Streptomyces sp. NPDC046374 TaxID=3154917 RepID=UPI0033DE625E